MKPTNTKRTKLTLNKTTLRTLTARELNEVGGGTDILRSIGDLCVRMLNSQQDPCNG